MLGDISGLEKIYIVCGYTCLLYTSTIITRTTTNTRMRDFYDIYILEQLHGNTLNPCLLYTSRCV